MAMKMRAAGPGNGPPTTSVAAVPDSTSPSPERTRPATMKDIALATGVSRSTVSRILNDAPLTVPIAPETRERAAAARRFGYRPNPLARALRGAPTMLLGAIVRDITDPFFAGAIEAVSINARALGYNIVLGHAHSRATEAYALAAILEARQCDAILLLGDMSDQPRLIDDLRDTHVPVVALWQGSELRGTPSVNVDNEAGIDTAIAHLASLGHQRIAFISGRLLGDIRERQAAYVESMARRTLDVLEGYLQHVTNTPAGGETALRALMDLATPPTAVVASTDALAIGVLHGAFAIGIRVPLDLSVVGFDDIPLAASTVPGLTTLHMPTAEMVGAAVQMAIQASGQPAGERESTVRVFSPQLVVRDSTAAPRGSRTGAAGWPRDGRPVAQLPVDGT
jgi:DNA-binding LacI/PurR family transcriptional regulator